MRKIVLLVWFGVFGFSQAFAGTKPLFVHFYSSTCYPCIMMEKGVFRDPEIQKILAENFQQEKIDCTHESPECRKLFDRYSVSGCPAFVITSPEGAVLKKVEGKLLSAKDLREVLAPFLSNGSR